MDSKPATAEWFRYRFLMGAMTQNALASTVRTMCVPDDVARLDEITTAWRNASTRMASLSATEAGLPDNISIRALPGSMQSRLHQIETDRLFRASFSAVPVSFKIIDIDHLVAPQRDVNLDYVDALRTRVPGASIEDLVEFCLGPRAEPPELKSLQTAPNQIVFSSRSLDLRFLGGFPKPLDEADIAVAYHGGQPVEAVTLLVGFGAAPINAWLVGTRVVLGNGFHRVVAMRMEGIQTIPIVIQHVANAEIEFPDQFLGLSRTYLLYQPRPVLLKDFFDDALTVELRLKPRRKVVKVAWGEESGVTPD